MVSVETSDVRFYSHLPLSEKALGILTDFRNFSDVELVTFVNQKGVKSFDPGEFDLKKVSDDKGVLSIYCSNTHGSYEFVIGGVQEGQPEITRDFDWFRHIKGVIFPDNVSQAIYRIKGREYQQWRFIQASWQGRNDYSEVIRKAIKESETDERSSVFYQYGRTDDSLKNLYVFRGDFFVSHNLLNNVIWARNVPVDSSCLEQISLAA